MATTPRNVYILSVCAIDDVRAQGSTASVAQCLISAMEKNAVPLMSVQYLRALAALLVVYFHMTASNFPSANGLWSFFVGQLGVDLFFVISGFIMWWTASNMKPGEFALRRLARIVPTYWIYSFMLVALAVCAPKLAPGIAVTSDTLMKSFFFIPNTNEPIVNQGWTLNIEMFFYGVFALALFLPSRAMRFAAVITALVGLSIVGVVLAPSHPILSAYTSSFLLEFAAGMVIAGFAQRLPMLPPVGIALVLISAAALIAFHDLPRPLAWGLPASVFLAGIVHLEPWLRSRPLPFLRVIGDASYSLYLCHTFILKVVAVALGVVGLATPILFVPLGVAACVTFAILSYWTFERPVSRVFASRPSAQSERANPLGE